MKFRFLLTLLTGVTLLCGTGDATAYTKNVILMISDGQGFNTVQATNYYSGLNAVYETFDVKYAMQTNSANNPAGYNPSAMTSNLNYAKSGATDSASAATAMYTGIKNYDGQVNMSTSGKPLTTYFETVAASGKSIGAVSSVEFTHATPTAVFGHNTSRNNYSEMAKEAVYGSNPNSNNDNYDSNNYAGNLKVVMGTGNPLYDANGNTLATPDYRYVGGSQAWTDLENGVNGWTLVQSKGAFEALTTGSTPDKVFGVAENISTLQQGRSAGSPPLTNVPTLETMTKAALNVLDNSLKGFSLMIEGGAVDWANHANQLDRMIEEQVDFNNAVQAVVDWVNTSSSWLETLLIVTADHECGYLWGDGNSGFYDVNGNSVYDVGVDYAHVTDNGVGNLPGAQYFSGSHTNSLVPLYAMGAGSELFAQYVNGTDPNLKALYNLDSTWNGQYLDNTAVFQVMSAASVSPVPEPSTAMLFSLGLGGLLFRIRRRQLDNAA